MTAQPLLATEGLGFDVSTRTLWNGVRFEVRPGSVVAVRGVSGQGKSTLLRCLGGLQVPARGRVRVLGEDVHRVGAAERRRLRREALGFVMQDHAVVPEWTVAQNLGVLRPAGTTRAALRERIDEALGVVGLGGRHRTRAGLLSGGEQQRVAVARVLAQRPRVVLADEPTASLDEESAERVRHGLDALRRTGSAIVVATHDPMLVEWAGAELDLADFAASASTRKP
ncbi:putative ABC transport system ATP-binding protein [Curtobacterium pusillum]|uniref:ABC transport system ATP-binding protein n=1 Tax=Curtobacterium pusillum TaxID=69373 RepID=A0AAW3T3L0_9MICO|nr:ATP-binding cassette domain-containing protein [Curtobacterium pusillum]MBA8989909.1 putative ABC transport system ATP-binding protein [Curtobacterium pusillum]